MKFTEIIREAEVVFEASEEKNKTIVNVQIPAYGHFLRGAPYKIYELSEIIVEKLKTKNLKPLFTDGIIHARQTKPVVLSLEFKKNNTANTHSKKN